MVAYAARRLVSLVGILFGISAVAFTLTALAPGDPAYSLLAMQQPGTVPSAQAVGALRAELGLDDPAPVRYVRWLGGAVQGDLGVSYRSGQPVFTEIVTRMPATLTLAGASLGVALLAGVPLGVLAAARGSSGWDACSRSLALLGATMPTYLLGLLLILVFAARLKLLPAFGSGTPQHLVLPTVALSASVIAQMMRLTRASMRETLGQPFMRTAKAKGLSARRVTVVHALRHAALPIVTATGLSIGHLVGGAVMVETIFSRNGVGKYAVDAIFVRDYPVIQGIVLYTAVAFVVVNFAVDVLYLWIDPRLRHA
ncbi:MAG: nickel ABC transporter permease [Egibacteraceae bacterium]